MKKTLPRIDFKKYHQRRYFLAVYTEWGYGTRRYATGFVRERCPMCSSAQRAGREFVWNFELGRYFCHSCKRSGDALQIVREMTGCSAVEAAKWLELNGGESGSGVVVTGG